jgi:hypothetical protein
MRAFQRLTENGANELEIAMKFVMPGLVPPCAGHPRLAFAKARKTWMAGAQPGHDQKDSYSSG